MQTDADSMSRPEHISPPEVRTPLSLSMCIYIYMYMYTSHCHVSSSSYVSACAYVCVLLQLYYNEKEAAKYNSSSRIVKVQQELSNRAIELLNLPAGQEAFVLDVGCGSGLSGGPMSYAHCFRTF